MKNLAFALVLATAALVVPTIAVGLSSPSAVAVLRALRAHGQPIAGYRSYMAANDPNHLLGRPGQYISKVNFHDKRLRFAPDYDTSAGGSIETFANTSDAKRRFKYVQSFGKTSMFAEYDYLSGLVLLRLSNDLTPAQAAIYKRALLKGDTIGPGGEPNARALPIYPARPALRRYEGWR